MACKVGIDYSMNSGAICINLNEKFIFFNVQSLNKKYEIKQQINDKILIISKFVPKKDFKNAEERFDTISDLFLEVLEKIHSEYEIDSIYIEDYAFAARGQVFHIAENTGVLKHKIYKRLNKNLFYVSPATVKKTATGKGNSKKDILADSFYSEHGIYLHEIFGCKKTDSPASDMVDAYYVQKSSNSLHFTKNYK